METLPDIVLAQRLVTQRHKNYSNLRCLYAALTGRINAKSPQQ